MEAVQQRDRVPIQLGATRNQMHWSLNYGRSVTYKLTDGTEMTGVLTSLTPVTDGEDANISWDFILLSGGRWHFGRTFKTGEGHGWIDRYPYF